MDSAAPLYELEQKYIERPDLFEIHDDEEFTDETKRFIEKTKEISQKILDECKKQKEEIDVFYADFLKYIGDDKKSLSVEKILEIMKLFGAKLEVIIY